MGTHFGGHVSLDARVASDSDTLIVTAKLDLAVSPAEVRMRLRSGEGRSLWGAEVNGTKASILEADTIRLPFKTTGEYRIVGRFR